jgi:hypothetical protein
MILGPRYWKDKQWINKGGETIFRWPRPNTRLLCLKEDGGKGDDEYHNY